MKVAQLCPTLCDPMDYTVHGVLQARRLEWVAVPTPGDLPNPGLPHCRQILYQLSYKSTSCEIACWMNHKLESRLPGEITTSDMQMILL